MAKLLPVALSIENWPVLVVGGGSVAARKITALLEAGALVTIISPTLSGDIPSYSRYLARTFEVGDCAGFRMVFAATDDYAVNALVVEEARVSGALVNDASAPDDSDFHTASIIRRGPITVGVTTNATSPTLARHVRQRLDAALGDEYERLFELLAQLSPEWSMQPSRGRFWSSLLASDVLELLRAGEEENARQRLIQLFESQA